MGLSEPPSVSTIVDGEAEHIDISESSLVSEIQVSHTIDNGIDLPCTAADGTT